MYPAGDGRLKTLNFVINNQAYLEAILTCGERVDGSSLFSFIEAGSSDLYVIPRFAQHSLIRLPRFRRCLCCALSSIKTANPSKVHQNTLFTKQARLLQKLPEWNSGNGRIGILCNSSGHRYVPGNRSTWLS